MNPSPSEPGLILDDLCSQDRASSQPVAVIAAHPDDEVIGAGARLSRWTACQVVYATDGSPENLRDARSSGFETRDAYAAARRAEARDALALAGVPVERIQELGFADQSASLHLTDLTMSVAGMLRSLQPEAVVTHPYEGGHPDHDATAFAVHAACELLRRSGGPAPVVVEMTSYHSCAGEIATGSFLPAASREVKTLPLSAEERALKLRMLACHRTQAVTLRYFPIQEECYRLAPAYDFTAPPHEGRLFYEHFDWRMTGERWRALAGSAMADLGLEGPQ